MLEGYLMLLHIPLFTIIYFAIKANHKELTFLFGFYMILSIIQFAVIGKTELESGALSSIYIYLMTFYIYFTYSIVALKRRYTYYKENGKKFSKFFYFTYIGIPLVSLLFLLGINSNLDNPPALMTWSGIGILNNFFQPMVLKALETMWKQERKN